MGESFVIKINQTNNSVIKTTQVERIIVKAEGIPGPQGPQGVQGVAGSDGATIFNHQLTSGEIAAGVLTLPSAPSNPAAVAVSVAGGCPQVYGIDFIISGTSLSWSGIGMQTVVSTGDYLTIEY